MDDFKLGMVILVVFWMGAGFGFAICIDNIEGHSAGGSVRNVAPEIRGVSFINTTVIVTCFDANGANDIVSCTVNNRSLERTEGNFSGEGVYAKGYVLYIGYGSGVIKVTDDDGLFDEWGA